jgi:chemotaxis protein CheZ
MKLDDLPVAAVPAVPLSEAPQGRQTLEEPVVKADGRSDVVTDQTQVDDLLASLGF